MSATLPNITIDTREEFQHLSLAPVAEAVIDLRAVATENFDEKSALNHLTPLLEGYRYLDSHQEVQIKQHLNLQGEAPPPLEHTLTWKGLRFTTNEGNKIAQFGRTGFSFSRLAPYDQWEMFFDEAMKLWGIYRLLAKPEEITRLGLRFINKIDLKPGDGDFERYLNSAPKPPKGLSLPFLGFLHQETFAAPPHPYAVTLVRTIQEPQEPGAGFSIIVDIDVFTHFVRNFSEDLIPKMLQEMRWLKNRVFFGSISEAALEDLK
ncbi:TIGR04255 family protein [Geomonas sp. Red32]|uniref:TIGR04255 family protein n=1 Tax=Geomonas sp. Red32 TaxID=2912856 RepID=UPI00202CABE2|nr:TIGR04255 family protein [Geomonas sp. Red32]MCM0083938.1 TIGR04255 family protein [Geomonas sp. Red32]